MCFGWRVERLCALISAAPDDERHESLFDQGIAISSQLRPVVAKAKTLAQIRIGRTIFTQFSAKCRPGIFPMVIKARNSQTGAESRWGRHDMAYEGSCHCGAVAFEVSTEIPTTAISCNCSHCRRKGFLFSFVPYDDFSVIRGEDLLTDYYFNKHAICHRFCAICGCQPFGRGKGPDGRQMAAINLRCVPSVDLDALAIQKVDGASF